MVAPRFMYDGVRGQKNTNGRRYRESKEAKKKKKQEEGGSWKENVQKRQATLVDKGAVEMTEAG